jgi:hypothetical protein
MPTAKAEVLRELHPMVVDRLFGHGPWLVDRESGPVLSAKLVQMGLDEIISDDGKSSRLTAFGREQRVDLQMVFMGLWEPWDALWVLEEHGLIDADERDRLEDRLSAGADPELLIRDRVRKAYFEYYCPRGYRA